METSAIHETAQPSRFTVRDFVAVGAERLCMEVVVADGLDHEVDEPMCNRPGLALTGFYGHFAWRRLQVIGNDGLPGNTEDLLDNHCSYSCTVLSCRTVPEHSLVMVLKKNLYEPGIS